ncbi:MAG: T9SS type A sorting domain-containing protein [Bacteroidetes bacterium]|nr:T9SS type A sorting domain-containing protein [Bacteroidota bacterium]
MKKHSPLFAALVLGTLLAQTVLGQSSKNMSLLGNYGKGEGESKGVFAAGSLVYYGLGNKIQIASFSNPSSPVKVGSVTVTDIVEDLVRTSLSGTQYIVASGGGKMWIANVQNPTAPSLVATVDVTSGSTCEGVATSGTYAYVAAGGAGLKIYNIATPASPSLVISIDSLEYCESVVISGQYAYIAAASRSHILDITNPAAPLYVGRIEGYGGYHQYINVRSGYAYVCNYDEGMAVVNVTNPAAPVNVMAVPSGYRTARIVFDGNYGYVAVGDSGMAVYNVVNPASPVYVTKIKTTGRAASLYYGAISIGGTPTGHIFVANRNPAPGVSAINVSAPATPTTSAFLAALPAPSGSAYTPFYLNGKVYVAYGTAGLRIIDVSSPSGASLLGTADLGGDSRAVVASGNYAYVAARDSGVYVVDVTNPASPVKIRTIKTPRARGIAINGNHVYVAASDSGMGIIDITNPAQASVVAYSGAAFYGENVAVNGTVGGLTDYGKITFYDLTNPAAPVKKGSTASFRVGNEGFAIADGRAYVPDGDSLKIYNVNNLNAPAMISKIRTGGYGYTAVVVGNYCYVASEGTGIRAINISNPSVPVEDGYFDGVPQSRGVAASGKYVYAAEKTDGLTIYSNDLLTSVSARSGMVPSAVALHQNYPNPFNPSTVISVDLNAKAMVTLDVFNALGQHVTQLVNRELAAGAYTVPFHGEGLSTGIYLYRLQVNGNTFTKKMMLVK